MTHTHGMDPIRREAEREAGKLVWTTAMRLYDLRTRLEVVKTSHIEGFPSGALTCAQIDKLEIGMSYIERGHLALKELSKELPNKT